MTLMDMQSLLLNTTQAMQSQMDSMCARLDNISQPPTARVPVASTSSPTAPQPSASPSPTAPQPSALAAPVPVVAAGADAGVTQQSGPPKGGEIAVDRPRYAPAIPATNDGASSYLIDPSSFSEAIDSMITDTDQVASSVASSSYLLAGAHVPLKIRTSIRQGEYIELGHMEPKTDASAKVGLTLTPSSVSLQPTRAPKASSKDQWLKWFNTYASIYSSTYPDASPELFTYANNVMALFQNNNYTFKQVLKYDEDFRWAKSIVPVSYTHLTLPTILLV